MIVFTLAGLYVCLALTFSLAISKWIPSDRLPSWRIPRGLEQTAAGGVILFSLLSLIIASEGIASTFGIPPVTAFLQMLYSTLQGRGWLGILLCGAIWYGTDLMAHTRVRYALQLAAAVGLILFAAVSMHAASLSIYAFSAQSVHLLAVSFWLGFLFLSGWFSQTGSPWRSFLAWFSPLAAVCVILVTVSGMMLMNALSNDWINALTLNYGQVLLIKHLLIIPLLAFASINGILTRMKLRRLPDFDPRSWIRIESIAALAVFTLTAALSRQAPPHNVRQTLSYSPPSPWFLQLYDGVVTPEVQLTFIARPLGFIFLVAALLFLGMTFLCYQRRYPPVMGLCTGMFFVLSGYLALMTAIK